LISVRSSSSYQRLINKVGHGPQPRTKALESTPHQMMSSDCSR
jgi:hypothetical protein